MPLTDGSVKSTFAGGKRIAHSSTMERSDRLPGRSPRIEADRDVVTFTFRIDAYEERVIELVIRCERAGEIFAALRSAKIADSHS